MSAANISFQRRNVLFDIIPNTDAVQTVVREAFSDGTSLNVEAFFMRIFDRVTSSTETPATPVPDSAVVFPGSTTAIDVLSNDIVGDSAIDPSHVTIALGPFHGAVVVNGSTGELEYTPDPGTTSDTIYYNIVNGTNISSTAAVDISIDGGT